MRSRRLLIAIIAVAFALVVVEAGMRIADQLGPGHGDSLTIADDRRGFALQPGFRGWTDTEGIVWVEINRDGMRDRDHSLVKPERTVRVAVLGDSFMQGVNVPVERTFPTFLEQGLAGCVQRSSRQAEVLNFGVGGYGTAQELLTYRHHASRYHPDVVLLAVYTGNDIFNNHRQLNEYSEIPYFVLRDGKLVLDGPTPPPATPQVEKPVPWYHRVRFSITDRLMSARVIWDGYALLRAPFVVPQVPDLARRDTTAAERARALYAPPLSTPLVDEAWAVTEALLSTLAREVAEQGSEFWLVTLSNTEQVEPDLARRRAFASSLGVDDLFYPDRRLRDHARAQGIPVISLAEPMAEHAAAQGVYLHGGYSEDLPPGTGHWNETGYQLAARLVSDRLCADSRALATRP